MKRTLDDIRANLDHVGCDNATALEMCSEIERLRALLRACLTDYGHHNFTDRYGMADRIRRALNSQ